MVTIAKEFHLGTDFPKIDHAMWHKQVEVELKGADFDKRMLSRSYEGIELQALYTEEVFPTGRDPGGLPGYEPFVRGAQPLGNMLAGWDVRQEHAHPDPAVANAHILEDLNGGVTSIDLRLDGAAMHGLDADNPHASHLTGHDGVSVSCVADIERLTRGVKLDIAGFHFDPGAAFLPVASLYVAAAKQAGVPLTELLGGFNADPLKVLARDGASADAARHGIAADGGSGGVDGEEYAAHDLGGGLIDALSQCRCVGGRRCRLRGGNRHRLPARTDRCGHRYRNRSAADDVQHGARLPLLSRDRQDPRRAQAVGRRGRGERRQPPRAEDAASRFHRSARADHSQPVAEYPAQHGRLLCRRGRRRRHHHHHAVRHADGTSGRGEPAQCPQHAVDPGGRMPSAAGGRSGRWLLVRRVVHQRSRQACVVGVPAGRGARRHGQGGHHRLGR